MNIIIDGSQNLSIKSLAKLSTILPPLFEGQALNYGQGEGQIQIEDTVWGLYQRVDGKYYLQYEEGMCEWSMFQRITAALMEQIRAQFGSHLEFKVEGKLEHYPQNEKYLASKQC